MNPGGGRQTIRFRLAIPAVTLERYYRGQGQTVVAQALDGRRLRFPARLLRDFIAHDGIHGLFEMDFDAHGHCLGLRRIGP